MMDQRLLRGRARFLAAAGIGLLFAAASGCGSVVASDSASAPAAAAGAGTTAAAAGAGTTAAAAGAGTTAAPQVGCASVNQATAVSIRHVLHMMVPVDTKQKPSTTYRDAAQVRALFGQMCAAVTHPAPNRLMHCPAEVGTEFLGTFYAGTRALATFSYAASGCARVSVTAAGKTLSTGVYGPAAAAAPHLATDLAAIVGTPKPGTMQPQGGVNPGGPNKPA